MFTDPFRYTPDPLVQQAADDLMHKLEGWAAMPEGTEEHELEKSLSEGKMLGVLLVRNSEGETSYLAGFSGNVNGCSTIRGFVPPIFDLTDPEGHFKIKEAELINLNTQISSLESSSELAELKESLSGMRKERDIELTSMKASMALSKAERDGIRSETEDSSRYAELVRESQFQKAEFRRAKLRWEDRIRSIEGEIKAHTDRIDALKKERAAKSEELQKWIFDRYIVTNANGVKASISEIFAGQGLVPPGGTGECAAPKLLNYAFNNGLTPLAMGEFWYGHSPETAVRTHGHFYPSCTSKCDPLLGFMLQGMSLCDPTPENDEYAIIYEDDFLLAADKPSGMPSVPGLAGRISLQERLISSYGTDIQAVHRLDMDTSGIILFAKDSETAIDLRRQFEEREIQKTYIARLSPQAVNRFICPPHLKEGDKGRISLPLSPDYDERPRQKADSSQGKPADTEYKILSINPDGSTDIIFTPHTGRTHQLRVHSAHIHGLGRPIIGDMLYGGSPASRLHLHALSITFRHPHTGETITLSTPGRPF